MGNNSWRQETDFEKGVISNEQADQIYDSASNNNDWCEKRNSFPPLVYSGRQSRLHKQSTNSKSKGAENHTLIWIGFRLNVIYYITKAIYYITKTRLHLLQFVKHSSTRPFQNIINRMKFNQKKIKNNTTPQRSEFLPGHEMHFQKHRHRDFMIYSENSYP